MNMRYKKAGEGLAKRITHTPLEIDVEHIYPMEKHATIKHLDDEKMMIDHSEVNLFVLGLSWFGVILFAHGFIWGTSFKEPISTFIIASPVYIGTLFFPFKSLPQPRKYSSSTAKRGQWPTWSWSGVPAKPSPSPRPASSSIEWDPMSEKALAW